MSRNLLITGKRLISWPNPTWLIPDFIPRGSICLLHGQPGTGKSFLALDWALSVAYGHPWQGRPIEQGHVIYITGEGIGGFPKRLKAWLVARGVGREHLDRVAFSTRAVDFSDDKGVELAIASMQRIAGGPEGESYDLIIVDTVARCLGSLNENLSTDMSKFVDQATKLSNSLNGCAVVLLHHSTKPSPEKATTERGSSALRGAVDAQFSMQDTDRGKGHIDLITQKQKDAEPAETLGLLREVISIGDDAFSCVIVKPGPIQVSARQMEALQALASAGSGGNVTVAEWRERAPSIPLKTFERVTAQLLKFGLVERAGKGVYSLSALGLKHLAKT